MATVVAAGVASATAASASTDPSGLGQVNAQNTNHTLLWGDVGNTRAQVQASESQLGRRMGVIRVYKQWNGSIGPNETWARDSGHRLLLSVSSHSNGQLIRWSSIVSAQPGSAVYANLVRWAQMIKAFHAPIYFIFNHEPEIRPNWSAGSPAQYVAAWQKWVNVFRSQGVTNAAFVFTTTAKAYNRTDGHNARQYYPGDQYVDDIAVDAYNWYGCLGGSPRDWVSLQSVIEPVRQFGLQHPGKGLILAEWASQEDNAHPGRKAAWIHDAQALFKQPGYGQFVALAAYTGNHATPHCNFTWASSASAKAAFKAMGADSHYKLGA